MAFTLPSDADAAPQDSGGSFVLPSDTAAPAATSAPDTGVGEALLSGAKHGISAGWSDQLGAAQEASGLPEKAQNLGPFGGALSASVGAARLAYEHLTGQPGPASAAYDQAMKDIVTRTQAVQSQHPIAYGAGELGGAGASMLVAPEARAAGLLGRMGQGAKIGAEYGAASGASSGEETGGLPGAVVGAGTGAVEGGVGGVGGELLGTGVGKLGSMAYDYLGRPIASTVRGLVNPTQEAARRVAGALYADQPQVAAGKALGMTPQQWVTARQAGDPVMLADLGGETTRALMRSAANSSPEGRAAINSVIADRFADQSDRAGMTIRSLVDGGANTAKTKAQLEAEYDAERGAAYQNAYDAGDKPVWSPELERLTTSPTVAGALRGAVNRWKDFQVKDGYGGMNPPVNVTPDGQLQFLGGKGMLPYPNLQLWDYASRNLAGMASAARRAGNNTDAGLFGGLEQQLKAELDKQVPEFADARGVASQYFGGNNAIEAGQQAVKFKGDVSELKQAMAKMKPAERGMFQESYADTMARGVENTGDNRDIGNMLLNSPQARQRFGAVMGPNAANTMDAFLSREKIYDAARKALGNSTTVRQAMEAGLAGGVGGLALTGDPKQALEYGTIAAGAGASGAASGLVRHGILTGAKSMFGYVDRNTAGAVAKLLASDDPRELQRGLQVAAKNQRIADGLRTMASKASSIFGAAKAPRLGAPQLPGAVGAEPQQQNVPGPPPQQNTGGRVGQKNGFAHGGAIKGESDGKVKVTKVKAHYRGGVEGKRCGLCTMFRVPHGCTAVRGVISPRGVCDLYEPVKESGSREGVSLRDRNRSTIRRAEGGDVGETPDPALPLQQIPVAGVRPPLQIDPAQNQFLQGHGAAFLNNVKPPRENIDTVLDSNFNYGRAVGNDMAPIKSLNSGISASASDATKVQRLVTQMSGPNGYWERPIVDDAGNVIEGQHRIAAAAQLGVPNVPVYRVQDLERGLPTDQMAKAIRDAQPTSSDQVHQIMGHALNMIGESGSPQAALNEWEFPKGFESRFQAALGAAGKVTAP